MTISLELDASYAALCAAGAVCRRERRLRFALARMLSRPRDEESWELVRECTGAGEEAALRADLELLEAVSHSGSAGTGLGGSPRTPLTEEETC